MSDQDSNPKQTGRMPRCPKCGSDSVTFGFNFDWGGTGVYVSCFGKCNGARTPVRTIADFMQFSTLAEENAQLRKALGEAETMIERIDFSNRTLAECGILELAKAALEQK